MGGSYRSEGKQSVYPTAQTDWAGRIWLVWFLCFNGLLTFVGYLMPILLEEQ